MLNCRARTGGDLLGHEDLRTTQRYIHRLGDWGAIDRARNRRWTPLSGASEPADLAIAAA